MAYYRKPADPRQRFWAKVDKTPTCWLWTGGLCAGTGYGHFFLGKVNGKDKNIGAHRFAYEQSVGPIPQGLDIDHLYD